MNCELKNLRCVQRCPAGLLHDLFLTTETIGDDQFVLTRFADFRQQHPLARGHADLVMIVFLFVAEGARHAAAAGLGMLMLKAHLVEDFFLREQDAEFLIVEFFQRLLMTVSMNQRFSFQFRNQY